MLQSGEGCRGTLFRGHRTEEQGEKITSQATDTPWFLYFESPKRLSNICYWENH